MAEQSSGLPSLSSVALLREMLQQAHAACDTYKAGFNLDMIAHSEAAVVVGDEALCQQIVEGLLRKASVRLMTSGLTLSLFSHFVAMSKRVCAGRS